MRLPLMIPFTMVVRNIFVQRPTQRALAKEKNLRQTLLFCRSYPALRVGVQIWTSRRQDQCLDAPASMIARGSAGLGGFRERVRLFLVPLIRRFLHQLIEPHPILISETGDTRTGGQVRDYPFAFSLQLS